MIVVDDDLPKVFVRPVDTDIVEGEDAGFTLWMQGHATSSGLTLNVRLTQQGDFIGNVPTEFTLYPNKRLHVLRVRTIDDSVAEAQGSVTLEIVDSANYRVADPGSASVGVFDNDSVHPTIVYIWANSRVVDEGEDVVFTLRRSGDTDSELTAHLRVTEQGYRRAYHNPVSRNEVEVTFAAGATRATLPLPTVDEVINDGNSTFTAQYMLDPAYGISPYPGGATVWVRDDDIPTVTVTPETREETEKPNEAWEFTLHRTGDNSRHLDIYLDYGYTRHWPPPFDDEVVTQQGGGTKIARGLTAGQSDRAYPQNPRNVGPLGGNGIVTIVPFYCGSNIWPCGYSPQYHIGEPSSASLTLHNNAMQVIVDADRESVVEGNAVEFNLTRYGGTPYLSIIPLTVRVGVTQNGEFIDGIPIQTVTFGGYPNPVELTKTVSIPTDDDGVEEEDGAITLSILKPDPDRAVENEANYELHNGRLALPTTATIAVTDNDYGGPAFSIADAETRREVYGSLSFTVTATVASERQMTVNWATAPSGGENAATAGLDYTAASGVLTFAVGETSKTITVMTLDDNRDEDDETFTVVLSNATHATIADATATGTIEDDESTAVVGIQGIFSTNVENEGSGVTQRVSYIAEGQYAHLVFYRSSFDVDYSDPDSIAAFTKYPLTVNVVVTQVGDFLLDEETPVTVTFPPGSTHGRIVLPTVDDNTLEPYGSIMVRLLQGDRYYLHDYDLPSDTDWENVVVVSDSVIVKDNDLKVSVNDARAEEYDGTIDFTVSLSESFTEPVTVKIATVDGNFPVGGNATSDGVRTETSLGDDFEAKTGTLTFAVGETAKTFVVTVLEDDIDEPTNERFTVQLSNPSDRVRLDDATGVGTIHDINPKMKAYLTIGVKRQEENRTGPIRFTLELFSQEGTISSERAMKVDWVLVPGPGATATATTTAAGIATEGEDYVAAGGRVTLPTGAVTNTGLIEVTLINDDLFEQKLEEFTVRLTGSVNLDLHEERRELVIKIRDDEELKSVVTADQNSVAEGGDANFTVTLPGGISTYPVVIPYSVAGTAKAGDDYTAPSGTLTIPAGESTGSITISTTQDGVADANETLVVDLTQGSSGDRNVNSPTGAATVRILEENTPTLSVAGVENTEGLVLDFTVVLSVALPDDLSVDWETPQTVNLGDISFGEAAADEDFEVKSGKVTIPAGGTSGTFRVRTIDDNLAESEETFQVSLSGVTVGADPNIATSVVLTTPPANRHHADGGAGRGARELGSNESDHNGHGGWSQRGFASNASLSDGGRRDCQGGRGLHGRPYPGW